MNIKQECYPIHLDGGERSASLLGYLTPKENAPGVNWPGGCVGPTDSLETMAKRLNTLPLLGIEHQPSIPQTISILTYLSRLQFFLWLYLFYL
jgi:hypothetical protein